MNQQKIYLNVLYKEKNEAKLEGCKWDSVKKLWYILENNPNFNELFEKYNPNRFHLIGKYKQQHKEIQKEKPKREFLLVEDN